jgi:hypothetical protein
MAETFTYDIENLALHWRKILRRSGLTVDREVWETGAELLARAAAEGHPRALFILAHDRFREARYGEGRACLTRLISGDYPPPIKAAAYRLLAIDAERRLGDISAALSYTDAALALEGLAPTLNQELERRKQRLEKIRS